MKRGGFLKRRKGFKAPTQGLRRMALRQIGTSETARLKQEIQRLVRAIVILRDGGCILRDVLGVPPCGGYTKDGELVLQADHLITRANSATYDDTRLIVCVCKGHHGWKKYHQKEYEARVGSILPRARVLLWETAEEASWRPTRRYMADWRLSIAALKQELQALEHGVRPGS